MRGAASVELSYADDADRDDPDKILEILKGAFGESRSADELLDILSTRKQKEKESLMEYSRVSMGLLKRAKEKDADLVQHSEKLLKKKFAENIRDAQLRKDVKKANRENGGWSFQRLREEAVKLAEDARETGSQRVRQDCHQVEEHKFLDPHMNVQTAGDKGISQREEAMSTMQRNLSEVLQLQKKLQDQLQAQQNTIDELKQMRQNGSREIPSNVGTANTKLRVKGPCFYCHKAGHLKRDCWKWKDDQKNKTIGTAISGQQYGQSVPYMWPGGYVPAQIQPPCGYGGLHVSTSPASNSSPAQ